MKRLNKEIVRFVVVGFSAFIIDFGILNTLVFVFDFRAQLFNFILLANVISTVSAVLFAFYFQKKWTFRIIDSQKAKTEFFLFVGLQLFNILFYSTLLFNLLVNAFDVPIPVAKILVVGGQTVTSYVAMKYFIFTYKKPGELKEDTV